MVNRLERHLAIVRDVARILKTGRLRTPSARDGAPQAETPSAQDDRAPSPTTPSRPSAAQVKRLLRRYLNRLEQQAPRRGRGAPTGHFVDHLVKLAKSYWPGLFHTYDHAEIPATTNALEGFFGSSKRSLRSITGRSSTAGGKMQSSGEVAIPVQYLVRVMPKADLEALLSSVSDADFVASKKKLQRLAEPARDRRRIQRDLGAYLDRALADWMAETLTRPP